jgi:hypothetical protein
VSRSRSSLADAIRAVVREECEPKWDHEKMAAQQAYLDWVSGVALGSLGHPPNSARKPSARSHRLPLGSAALLAVPAFLLGMLLGRRP